jgi:hypothetical protein
MSTRVGKLEAASHQLDWAIRLLIDHDAPVPAITLAGAAEELIGKALGPISAHEQLADTFVARFGLPRKVVSQSHLNKARNWLKHWDVASEPEFEDFELLPEAVQLIVRGISNMLSHNGSMPFEGPRFLEWVRSQGLAE